MPKIWHFQHIKCEELLLSFGLYHCKFNNSRFLDCWSDKTRKQDVILGSWYGHYHVLSKISYSSSCDICLCPCSPCSCLRKDKKILSDLYSCLNCHINLHFVICIGNPWAICKWEFVMHGESNKSRQWYVDHELLSLPYTLQLAEFGYNKSFPNQYWSVSREKK